MERSIKVASRKLLPDRILLSIHKDAMGKNPSNELFLLLKGLGCPQQACSLMQKYLENAEIIHLGYELDGEKLLYKCYLEFPGQFRMAQQKPADSDGILVHVASKWEPVPGGVLAVSHYHGFAGLTCMDIIDKIRDRIYDTTPGSAVLDVLYEISDSSPAPAVDDVMLMLVTEPGNDRLSFDLNIYNWEMTIADIRPQIDQIMSSFDIPDDTSRVYLDAHHDEVTGHISGGYDRSGNEFFTLYHGVEEYVP